MSLARVYGRGDEPAPPGMARARAKALLLNAAGRENQMSSTPPRPRARDQSQKRVAHSRGAFRESIQSSCVLDLSARINTAAASSEVVAAFDALHSTAAEQIFLHANPAMSEQVVLSLSRLEAPTLRKLHLHESGNITDAGAIALADAIRSRAWPQLEDLNVACNRIGDEGALAFAFAMRVGLPTLRDLSLSSNRIGDLGATALIGAVFGAGTTTTTRLPQLATVRLARNHIGPGGMRALARALAAPELPLHHAPLLTVFDVSEQECYHHGRAADTALVTLNAQSDTLRPLCWTPKSDPLYKDNLSHLSEDEIVQGDMRAIDLTNLPAHVRALIRRDGRAAPLIEPSPAPALPPVPKDPIEAALAMAAAAALAIEQRIAESAATDLAERTQRASVN